ncbi:MAG: hypothetical protein V5A43_05865 [Haloarculaceae archaeon]
MDESALRDRLRSIERRQTIGISLLVGIYLFGGYLLLVGEIPSVTEYSATTALVALGLVALVVGIYRRRRAR